MKIIIPARKGSKGLPFKYNILLNHTLSTIPEYVKKDVVVTTNDGEIIQECVGYRVLLRSEELSADNVSTKEVLKDALQKFNIDGEELILMLYLTYPERTWTDIEAALNYLKQLYLYFSWRKYFSHNRKYRTFQILVLIRKTALNTDRIQ